MLPPTWFEIVRAVEVPAPSDTLWVKVFDFVRGPSRLRIQAGGTWKYDLHTDSGPDGNPADGFDDTNLAKWALRGCLLAKVGGSAGDTPNEGGTSKVQAVGSYCVFDIPAEVAGGLFLTMNDNPRRFHLHAGKLTVTIATAPTN
jgi:hypothetical protein